MSLKSFRVELSGRLYGVHRVDVNMAFTSGIRASGSGSSEYVKKTVLKDASSYGPWRTKLTAILDAEEF